MVCQVIGHPETIEGLSDQGNYFEVFLVHDITTNTWYAYDPTEDPGLRWKQAFLDPANAGRGPGGLFDAANNGATIAVDTVVQDGDFVWNVSDLRNSTIFNAGVLEFNTLTQINTVETEVEINFTSGVLDIKGVIYKGFNENGQGIGGDYSNLPPNALVPRAYVDDAVSTVSGGGGPTNLSLGAITGTTIEVLSSTGTDINLPAVTTTNAGLMSATDKVKINALPSTVDGSETKVQAGTNVTVSGTGTIGSPYVINANGSGGATDLSLGTHNGTTLDVLSSTGTDVTLPAATTTLAGLMSATDKVKLDSAPTTDTNLANTNLVQTTARTYTFTGQNLSFLGGNDLLLQSNALRIGRAGNAETASIPTLSPNEAALPVDTAGFLRILNHNGTLKGTGYTSVTDLFNLVIRDQFTMQSVGSTLHTTTRYNSTTPLALTNVPTSLLTGYAFNANLNRGFVGINNNNVTTLVSNTTVVVESPTLARIKSANATIDVEPEVITLDPTNAGLIILENVGVYATVGDASALPTGALYSVNGVLYIK